MFSLPDRLLVSASAAILEQLKVIEPLHGLKDRKGQKLSFDPETSQLNEIFKLPNKTFKDIWNHLVLHYAYPETEAKEEAESGENATKNPLMSTPIIIIDHKPKPADFSFLSGDDDMEGEEYKEEEHNIMEKVTSGAMRAGLPYLLAVQNCKLLMSDISSFGVEASQRFFFRYHALKTSKTNLDVKQPVKEQEDANEFFVFIREDFFCAYKKQNSSSAWEHDLFARIEAKSETLSPFPPALSTILVKREVVWEIVSLLMQPQVKEGFAEDYAQMIRGKRLPKNSPIIVLMAALAASSSTPEYNILDKPLTQDNSLVSWLAQNLSSTRSLLITDILGELARQSAAFYTQHFEPIFLQPICLSPKPIKNSDICKLQVVSEDNVKKALQDASKLIPRRDYLVLGLRNQEFPKTISGITPLSISSRSSPEDDALTYYLAHRQAVFEGGRVRMALYLKEKKPEAIDGEETLALPSLTTQHQSDDDEKEINDASEKVKEKILNAHTLWQTLKDKKIKIEDPDKVLAAIGIKMNETLGKLYKKHALQTLHQVAPFLRPFHNKEYIDSKLMPFLQQPIKQRVNFIESWRVLPKNDFLRGQGILLKPEEDDLSHLREEFQRNGLCMLEAVFTDCDKKATEWSCIQDEIEIKASPSFTFTYIRLKEVEPKNSLLAIYVRVDFWDFVSKMDDGKDLPPFNDIKNQSGDNSQHKMSPLKANNLAKRELVWYLLQMLVSEPVVLHQVSSQILPKIRQCPGIGDVFEQAMLTLVQGQKIFEGVDSLDLPSLPAILATIWPDSFLLKDLLEAMLINKDRQSHYPSVFDVVVANGVDGFKPKRSLVDPSPICLFVVKDAKVIIPDDFEVATELFEPVKYILKQTVQLHDNQRLALFFDQKLLVGSPASIENQEKKELKCPPMASDDDYNLSLEQWKDAQFERKKFLEIYESIQSSEETSNRIPALIKLCKLIRKQKREFQKRESKDEDDDECGQDQKEDIEQPPTDQPEIKDSKVNQATPFQNENENTKTQIDEPERIKSMVSNDEDSEKDFKITIDDSSKAKKDLPETSEKETIPIFNSTLLADQSTTDSKPLSIATETRHEPANSPQHKPADITCNAIEFEQKDLKLQQSKNEEENTVSLQSIGQSAQPANLTKTTADAERSALGENAVDFHNLTDQKVVTINPGQHKLDNVITTSLNIKDRNDNQPKVQSPSKAKVEPSVNNHPPTPDTKNPEYTSEKNASEPKQKISGKDNDKNENPEQLNQVSHSSGKKGTQGQSQSKKSWATWRNAIILVIILIFLAGIGCSLLYYKLIKEERSAKTSEKQA